MTTNLCPACGNRADDEQHDRPRPCLVVCERLFGRTTGGQFVQDGETFIVSPELEQWAISVSDEWGSRS